MQAAPDSGLSPALKNKPWSISASLRGFYDDNITTVSDNRAIGRFGIEFSPSANFRMATDQTVAQLGYEYKLRWFENRDPDNSDHSHRFSAKIEHDVNETLSIDTGDTFTIAQEPSVVDSATNRRLRTDLDAIHNEAYVNFSVQLSRIYSLLIGYQNDYYNYSNDGNNSFSALLDRLEHRGTLNLRRELNPTTSGLLGYQLRVVDHTSDDDLVVGGTAYDADTRNSISHYAYVGVDHNFTPQLHGGIRAGAQFTTYNNYDTGDLGQTNADDSQVSPYVDVNLSYNYAEGSVASLGIRHERNQTDVLNALDQEMTSLYASVSHQVTSKLRAGVNALYSRSGFGDSLGGGSFSDDFFSVGLELAYQINTFLSAEAGYNFYDLSSDLDDSSPAGFERSFDRNRVYLGLRATY